MLQDAIMHNITLNYEEIITHAEKITKTKSFINKYLWGRVNFSSKKMIGKNLRKLM